MAAKRGQGGFRPGEDLAAPADPPVQAATFTAAADAGGTDRDVLMGYQLFLGRDPESSFVIADARNSPVGAFIRALMGSGEFQSAVLDRLAAGRKLPHEAFAQAPSPEQLDWLFGLLHVPPRAEAVLRAATGWAEWLRTLVAIPGLPTAPSRSAAPADGPEARPAGEGFVLVTIEQPRPGERLRPGTQLHGSGWAIAPADIAEVAIHLDGTLLTHARYGLPRPDVARSFPHYRHVDHCGFSFTAELPAGAAEAGQLTVTVRSADGQTGRKGVRLEAPLAPAAAEPSSAAGASETAWPIRLLVEEAVIDAARMLRVRGWAISAEAMQPIAVTLGEVTLGEARHGLPRPDIAATHPSYANSAAAGFALVRQLDPGLPEGPSFVRVQASDAAGHARQSIVPVIVPAAPAPVAAPAEAHPIAASCTRALLGTDGTLRVEGWARAASGIAAIAVELDGISLGQAELGPPDAALAEDGTAPDAATAGFAFSHNLPRRPSTGVHRLVLLVTAQDGAARALEMPLVAERRRARRRAGPPQGRRQPGPRQADRAPLRPWHAAGNRPPRAHRRRGRRAGARRAHHRRLGRRPRRHRPGLDLL